MRYDNAPGLQHSSSVYLHKKSNGLKQRKIFTRERDILHFFAQLGVHFPVDFRLLKTRRTSLQCCLRFLLVLVIQLYNYVQFPVIDNLKQRNRQRGRGINVNRFRQTQETPKNNFDKIDPTRHPEKHPKVSTALVWKFFTFFNLAETVFRRFQQSHQCRKCDSVYFDLLFPMADSFCSFLVFFLKKIIIYDKSLEKC